MLKHRSSGKKPRVHWTAKVLGLSKTLYAIWYLRGPMDKSFEKHLFTARKEWFNGNHSSTNLWAKWKFEEAHRIKEPNCGTYKYWCSIVSKDNKLTSIEQMVRWAENVLWTANLKPSYTVVNSYVKSDGTYVSSHLRQI